MDSAPPEPVSRPLSFVAAAGWTLLVAILFEAAAGITDAVHPGALGDIVSVATCKLLAYSVVLFALVRVHEPEASLRSVLALRRTPVSVVALATFIGAALAPAAMWLEEVFTARFPAPEADAETLERLLAAPTPGKKVALVVALVVVLPVFDELFFRGALFTPLKKGRRAEVVVMATAAYDTLLGASAREMASLMLMALAIAWIRALSGSVVPSIAARVAFFGVQVVPLALGRDTPRITKLVALGGAAAAALALAALAAVSRRSPRAVAARLDDG